MVGTDPRLHVGQWVVPSDVEPDGHGIKWRVVDGGGDGTEMGPKMLERFIGLADADALTVARYARRWGVLRLCEHGLPETHTVDLGWYLDRPISGGRGPCAYVGSGEPGWWHEPLQAWHSFARQAEAVVSLAVALRRDSLGDARTWATVPDYPVEVVEPPVHHTPGPLDFGQEWLAQPLPTPESVEEGRRVLGQVVDQWLRWGQVRNRLHWDTAEPTLTVQPHGLFGAIAMQVASRVTGRAALAICHNCGSLYAPKKRPDPNRRNYCPDCREAGAPQRDARRKYRADQRAKKAAEKQKGSA